MRGQVIAGQGYPMLCSLQRVIGPPFRGREEDCRKPREQGNKKSRMNKGFGNKPNTRSHGPGSLGFETLALITRCLLFSYGLSVGYHF